MELGDFISSALLDIAEGIEAANSTLFEKRGKKRPQDSVYFILGPAVGNKGHTHVEFDVAVTTKAVKSGKGRGGLALKVVELGGEKSSEKSSERVSHIKFAVQVATNLT